jgi:hypothetical protein
MCVCVCVCVSVCLCTSTSDDCACLCAYRCSSLSQPPPEGKELAKTFGCKFLETSAKNKINVDEAFHDLVREIRRHSRDAAPGGESKKARTKKFKCTVM